MRSVAREFGVSLLTVQRWVERSGEAPLDAVDFSDRPRSAHVVANRTDAEVESAVLALRRELAEQSALGEYGAAAIRLEMEARGAAALPSVRTIHRILERLGALDGKRRIRRKAPPPGWYLPEAAAGRAEIDQFDVVQGLVIEGGTDVEVLNGVSVHGGLIASFVCGSVTTAFTRECLIAHWREFGLPAFAQFDNDTRFQGAHQFADTIGTVTKMCLSLGVTPVFAPVQETGFQAAVESLNNRWQQKVWNRFHHESIEALAAQSARYVHAARSRTALRQEGAPTRRAFPDHWAFNPSDCPRGVIIYIRRTNEHGQASLLGHLFEVAAHWPHRLVRCEVNLDHNIIRFYALRRREPNQQTLLAQVDHHLPNKTKDG